MAECKKYVAKMAIDNCTSLLIFAIGLSRVYLRVHYASDVMAGYCVGCMWLLLSLWILKKIEKFSSKKVDPVIEENRTPISNRALNFLLYT